MRHGMAGMDSGQVGISPSLCSLSFTYPATTSTGVKLSSLEKLTLATKKLHVAAQIAHLDANDILDEYLDTFRFPSEESRKLSKVALWEGLVLRFWQRFCYHFGTVLPHWGHPGGQWQQQSYGVRSDF